LLRRTKPQPEINGPVSIYETAVLSLVSRYDGWVAARDAASVKLGEQREAQQALDQQFRGVGLAINTAFRGRRNNVAMQTYFPNGYGSVLRLQASESLSIAAGLVAQMEGEDVADIIARREPLTAARAQLETAVAARQAADDAVKEASGLLEDEKLAFRTAHITFYLTLRAMFPDRRRWIESLFKVSGRPQHETEDDPEDGKTVDASRVSSNDVEFAVKHDLEIAS
jgi:hypothetical protein